MPIYEFECPTCKRKFEKLGEMGAVLPPRCPNCSVVTRQLISLSTFRVAEPVTIYQDLGSQGGQHRGYQKIGWQADSGISPKPGQPYKTPEGVAKEEYGGVKEV